MKMAHSVVLASRTYSAGFATASRNYRVVGARTFTVPEEKPNFHFVEVQLEAPQKEKKTLRFPCSYLRDNSSMNFHPTTLMRTIPMNRDFLHAFPETLSVENDRLHVLWDPAAGFGCRKSGKLLIVVAGQYNIAVVQHMINLVSHKIE